MAACGMYMQAKLSELARLVHPGPDMLLLLGHDVCRCVRATRIAVRGYTKDAYGSSRGAASWPAGSCIAACAA